MDQAIIGRMSILMGLNSVAVYYEYNLGYYLCKSVNREMSYLLMCKDILFLLVLKINFSFPTPNSSPCLLYLAYVYA